MSAKAPTPTPRSAPENPIARELRIRTDRAEQAWRQERRLLWAVLLVAIANLGLLLAML